jgi:hypothetical protein
MFSRSRAVEHDLRGAELVAAVDDRHLVGELRGRSSPPSPSRRRRRRRRRLPLKKAPSQTSAVGDAAAAELLLAGDRRASWLGAHREDHGCGEVLVVADPDLVDAAVGELDAVDVVGDEARAEALGLGAELLIISGPMIPSGKPG